jgi:hypothetical protein
MKKLHSVIGAPHSTGAARWTPMTLGWTEFAIMLLVIVMVLLLTGLAIW